MGIHMVVKVEDESFHVTLSRDEAGNYTADATGPFRKGRAICSSTPIVRVVDVTKENALKSLLDSLQRMSGSSLRGGGGAPALG